MQLIPVKPTEKRGNKMSEIRVNLTNFITIGLMAFVAIYAINKGLSMAGKEAWRL